MHEMLGNIVSYTPVYHAASLGHLERQHRDMKKSLRAALLEMGDTHGSAWTRALPWVMLVKKTAFQADLGASPAEVVYGQTLLVPGDLAGADINLDPDIPSLLARLRQQASKDPVQTAHHSTPKVHLPEDMKRATHVLTLRQQPAPLGARWDGPFEILERRGSTCLLIKVGEFVKGGAPRTELVHWSNCKVAHFLNEPYTVDRPTLGRRANNK